MPAARPRSGRRTARTDRSVGAGGRGRGGRSRPRPAPPAGSAHARSRSRPGSAVTVTRDPGLVPADRGVGDPVAAVAAEVGMDDLVAAEVRDPGHVIAGARVDRRPGDVLVPGRLVRRRASGGGALEGGEHPAAADLRRLRGLGGRRSEPGPRAPLRTRRRPTLTHAIHAPVPTSPHAPIIGWQAASDSPLAGRLGQSARGRHGRLIAAYRQKAVQRVGAGTCR